MLKHRHLLRKKDASQILEKIECAFGLNIDGDIEIGQYGNITVFLVDGKIHGFFIVDKPAPTVEWLRMCRPHQRYVTVDDGAIKFILNGADVMVPGIIDADHIIEKNDAVWIRDVRGLPLAVGQALMRGIDMVQAEGGRAVTIRHYIGDDLWRASRSV